REGSERLVDRPGQCGVQAGHQRVQGPAATGVHGRQEERPAAGGCPQVRPMHPRQRREGLPGPHPRWGPHRHGTNPNRQSERWYEHSPRRDAEVRRLRGGGGGDGGPVMRKRWVLAGAAVVVAVTVTGGVVVMSGAQEVSPAAQELTVNTATVEKGKLSAMVSLYGILTYRARSDGLPYSL